MVLIFIGFCFFTYTQVDTANIPLYNMDIRERKVLTDYETNYFNR